MKFRTLQHNGCINTIINVQTWHWAVLPRNSDWPWLLNESYFWARLNKGGLPPIFETLFTIWRRGVHQRKNPSLPDGTHFHSLIYRRITRSAYSGEQSYRANAKTSPYLWALSSLGVIPALLWWHFTPALMVGAVVFVIVYNLTYRQIVTFRTRHWTGRPPKNK